ncbi:Ltp family lipoprotein [Companilactobacillus formosensis]|uniref:Ltp family lipoprotein n=1 Tax=Companilactobacillus formosensis TaxID=1617889 RepID=UPI000E65CBB2|nr:Ltp family lipoprotein [Companilactobacillus formosensis]
MQRSRQKVKRKWFKKKRTWFIIAILVFISIGVNGMSNTSNGSNKDNSSQVSVREKKNSSKKVSNVKEESVESKQAVVPTEYKSALRKAESYSRNFHMSKQGIHEQLTSEYGEKFSQEAANYAMDNIEADWNENALKKAKSYQEDQNMSPEAVREQLTSEYGEQFTPEEANYAVNHLNN